MSRAARGVLAALILAPVIVVPLIVGLYNRAEPELWGFPFYFWFQMLLVPCGALLIAVAYWITKGDRR